MISLDSRVRGNDEKGPVTFSEFFNHQSTINNQQLSITRGEMRNAKDLYA